MFGEKTIASILVIMLGNPPGEEATTPEQPQVERRAPARQSQPLAQTSANRYMQDNSLGALRLKRKRRKVVDPADLEATRAARRARREARLKASIERTEAENARRDN